MDRNFTCRLTAKQLPIDRNREFLGGIATARAKKPPSVHV